jgi:hypothetical protein
MTTLVKPFHREWNFEGFGSTILIYLKYNLKGKDKATPGQALRVAGG